jgi:hypothetical protein
MGLMLPFMFFWLYQLIYYLQNIHNLLENIFNIESIRISYLKFFLNGFTLIYNKIELKNPGEYSIHITIMEKRLNKKFETYFGELKDNIRNKMTELDILKYPESNQLLQYIYDYERFNLNKEDFMKRKRVKNAVVLSDRCCAKRANGEQCTRKKKDQDEYCGTHLKGTPHGIIEIGSQEKSSNLKVEVWAQDIQGIIYYIDKSNNVYQAEDIVVNKINPKIVAKYVKNGDQYSIPNFGL